MTLLLKDYFRRYGRAILAFLVAVAVLRLLTIFISEDTQVSLLVGAGDRDAGILERVLLVVLVYSMAATHLIGDTGYIVALGGFMMAMAEVGEKWPRVALGLPVSRRTIALALWIKCVLFPSLLVTAAVLIILAIDPWNALALEGGPTVSLAKILVTSMCFTGIACLYIQTIDALAARYPGTPDSHKPNLTRDASIVLTTLCFFLFLILLGFVFERWSNLRSHDLLLFGIALAMTALSFFNRQSLVHQFESFRVTRKRKEALSPPETPRDTVWRVPGFAGSYARLGRLVLATTLVMCCLSLPFSTVKMQWLPMSVSGALMWDLMDMFLGATTHPEGVLIFFLFSGFLILMSFMCTPPLRVCRVLPHSAFQLYLRLLAFPAIIFGVFMLTVLPFVLFCSVWNVAHALAILYLAFGFVVFVTGIPALFTDKVLEVTIILICVGFGSAFFFFGVTLLDFMETIAHTPSTLVILGSLFFVLGNVIWYRVIAYASPAYRVSLQQEQGKIVL